ncbi:MAG: 30S ribosomal protein S9 [Candidatus Micrarchaeota archaeon]|nr:30S ribosomal protein S9 [Candidatus Micrarchaeota archaeon]
MANETGLDNLNKELAGVIQQPEPQQKTAVKKAPVKRKPVSKKNKPVIEKARRKMAVARARLMPGTPVITFNNFDISTLKPTELREMILEPVNMSSLTKDIAAKSNISINVYGGGSSGQAQAARSALAKVIARAASSDVIKKMYMDYDRTLLVDDVRQVEPKKYKGPKARARFQKSYR